MSVIQATVLAVAALAGSLHTLVLGSGERFAVRADVRIEEGLVVFRTDSGSLYSIPLSEIDLPRTEAANEMPRRAQAPAGPKRSADQARVDLEQLLADRSLSGRQIVVSEEEKRRLIEEAQKSRGTPGEPAPLPKFDESGSTSSAERASRDEWYWREKSRAHHDRVERARENLELIVERERRLQDEILGLLSLGYKPDQFNLQVLQLAHARDSIPRAQLDLQRAERELARFKDDARRQGILPGWLR
jgi:hypothetical protein